MLIDKIALILMIIGGLNWGLIGIFKLDLVALLCGGQTGAISRIVHSGRTGGSMVYLAALPTVMTPHSRKPS